MAPLAGALERPQLGKARFPIAQDVLRQPRLARQLPDRAESGVGLVGSAGHFCRYPAATMRSRIIWLARKVSTRRGAIGTSTPVLGLRPIRSPLSRRTKVPKPEILTFSPSASAPHIDRKSTRLNSSH